jgi:imidazolonepropionase-like amidohydrolase
MDDKAIAVMAIAFFGTIAISIRALASVWTARIEARRYGLPTTAFADQLARIESAVEVMAVEIERISEAQRFSARLMSERQRELLPKTPLQAEQRLVTPH